MAAGAVRMAFSKIAPLFKGASKTDLALRFGPDIGYSLMAGTMFAPENATMGERGLMMGEDLLYGVGSSLVGQSIGRGLGRRKAAGLMQGKKGPQARQDYHNMVNGYQTGGDVLGQMSMVALPRPISQGVYEAAGERANETMQQVSANQQQLVEEQQLTAALAALVQGGVIKGVNSAPPPRSMHTVVDQLALGPTAQMNGMGSGPLMTTATNRTGGY